MHCSLAHRLSVFTFCIAFIGIPLFPSPALCQATLPTKAEPAASPALLLDQKIIADAKDSSEVLKNLAYLSDEIGARLTGSANLKRANEWTMAKFKEYGLTNVHLESWTIPAAWERGSAAGRIVEPPTGHALTLASMAWTGSTNGKITGDVVIIDAKTSKELAAYKGKLKNAIVLQGEPAFVRPMSEKGWSIWFGKPNSQFDLTMVTGRAPKNDKEKKDAGKGQQGLSLNLLMQVMRQMAFRREISAFMRSEGALALLMDSAKPHGLLNMSGAWSGNDRASAVDPMPSVFVSHEDFSLLYRLAKRPAPARTRVELEIVNRSVPGPAICYNTVAEIRGREIPDECVVLGAHLDSWDLGEGTTDNGTGSMVVLEAARVLARSGFQPRRTIRFILFTGEEQGLCGSVAYVKEHKAEMKKVSMCLVHDTGTGRVEGLGLHGRKAAQKVLEKELASLKEIGLKDLHQGFLPGSDHWTFHQAGVPGFLCDQNMDEYFLTHHSQSDTFDKANEADLIQGVQVMAVAGARIANLPELLPRD
jgi:hypothetical protein